MEMNGIVMPEIKVSTDGKIDFFHGVQPGTKCEPVSEMNGRAVSLAIKEANINGDIPARYAKARLSDYEWSCADKVREFALSKDNDRMFILFGDSGRGKTTLMCAAMHERAVNGLSAGYYFSDFMLMSVLRSRRSFSSAENEETFIKRLINCPFLCIDEAGICENMEEEKNFLRTLILGLYNNSLPLFISTNLSPVNFKLFLCGQHISDREKALETCALLEKKDPVLNRLKSLAITATLTGESFRTAQGA